MLNFNFLKLIIKYDVFMINISFEILSQKHGKMEKMKRMS